MRTVRIRLTLIATLLVSVALAAAGVALALALNHLLTGSADNAGTARTQQIVVALDEGGLPGVTPAMLLPGDDVDIIQVITADGRVARTSASEFDVALTPTAVPGTLEHVAGVGRAFGAEYRATVAGTTTADDGDLTVVVAFADRRIDTTVITVAALCCLTFPFVVLGMAWLTYNVVGRTLRPVEDLRSHAAEITGGDLSQRLPVPATADEIAALAETMNEMLARVEVARRRQSQFVNDASHELNSPLTSILGIVEFAASNDDGVDPATVKSLLLPESLQLKKLVSDLLFLARADEHGVPKRDIQVDLDDVVGAEVARLRRVSAVTVHADIVAARVFGDPTQLARAVRNLTDNALAHANHAVSVTMSIDETAREATVTVIDDGPGVPVDEHRRVFDRFVRLDNARERQGGGSGLGLAIVAEITAAHGGRVALVPSQTGARVELTLPLDYPPSGSSR